MRDVLQPLKIRDHHTSSIQEHIRENNHSFVCQDTISLRGSRSVCSFTNNLRLNVVGVVSCDLLFECSRNQHITFKLQCFQTLGSTTYALLAVGKVQNGAGLRLMFLELLDIKTVLVIDETIVLDNADHLGTSLMEELGRIKTDVTETLNDNTLSFDARGETDRLGHSLLMEELTETVEHTESGGFGTTTDTTVLEGLAGHNGHGVHIIRSELLVGLLDPGHLASTSAHVRSRYIDTGADKVLLGQLGGEATSDALEFAFAERLRVDEDTTLAAAVRHVHHGTLVGHESSEGLHLILVHQQAVANATLGGTPMARVMSAVGLHGGHTSVVTLQWEGETHQRVCLADAVQQILVVSGELGRLVKVHGHTLEEGGLSSIMLTRSRSTVEARRSVQRRQRGDSTAAEERTRTQARKETRSQHVW
mmetsp:Transcript_23457/g.58701  ORF Transcript_23457/g.58701 Transcript_23457/m.58701 type:complete len:421 (-) Transcript_23457:104-1366(-)